MTALSVFPQLQLRRRHKLPEVWLTVSSMLSLFSRRSSSSSEAVSSQHSVDSMSDSRRSSRETSPCRSFDHTKEDHFNAEWSRGDPGTGSCEGPRGDPHTVDPVQVCVSGSLDASEKNSSNRSKPAHPDGSFSDSQELSAAGSLGLSEESSTPVTSITCPLSGSTVSQYEDLKEDQSAGRKHSNGFMQNSSTPSAWRGSKKVSAPVLKFTRQLSVGGVGSTVGIHQSQNYHPFPKRKIPRISEAARRLGMYSSFWEAQESAEDHKEFQTETKNIQYEINIWLRNKWWNEWIV